MNNKNYLSTIAAWRVYFSFGIGLAIYAIFDSYSPLDKFSFSKLYQASPSLINFYGLVALYFLVLLFLTFKRYSTKLINWLDSPSSLWSIILSLALSIAINIFVYFYPSVSGFFNEREGARLLLAHLMILLLSFPAKYFFRSLNTPHIFYSVLIFYSMICATVLFLGKISSNPFVSGWSESSRYYDASLLLSQRIYHNNVPLSVLHPALHLLLAIPYVFGTLSIAYHRAWYALLNFCLPLLTVFSLARRFNLPILIKWLYIGWAFLFLLQGPIYAHLLIIPIIIFSFYNNKKEKQTWILIILTSAWAGISRINWFPVPAMLICALYFLETPFNLQKKYFNYLLKPFLWFIVGVGVAIISQSMYIFLSGNANSPGSFVSSLSSRLLWYRLLPNTTYPLGILPSIFFITLPLLLVLVSWLFKKSILLIRKLLLVGEILILFAGGLIVSVKIGGGADLHNMDAYLVLLLLVCSYIFFNKVRGDDEVALQTTTMRWEIIAMAILIPAIGLLQRGFSLNSYDQVTVDKSISEIQSKVDTVVKNKGEVLFITQRHLLSLNIIKNVPLVSDYERDYLMEMIMSNNQDYLRKFKNDIENKRFSLIVVSPQHYFIFPPKKILQHPFGEENNLWVQNVTKPLLCNYIPLKTSDVNDFQILVPSFEAKCP